MGGSPKINVPAPPPASAEERDLMRLQAEYLRRQGAMTEAMYEDQRQYGGEIRDLTREQLAYQREQMAREREMYPEMAAYNREALAMQRRQMAMYEEMYPEMREYNRQSMEAQREQLAQQRESARLEALMRPGMLQQQGYREVRDAEGRVIGVEEIPEVAAQRARQREIEAKLGERTLAALAGNLPVDPALERGLSEQEALLRESLTRQLGAGYETSTPGIQALNDFRQRAEEARAGARTGQLTLAEQLGMARSAGGQNVANARQAGLQALTASPFQRQTLGQMGLTAPGMLSARPVQTVMDPALGMSPELFGSVAQGYGAAASPYQQMRQQQFGYGAQAAMAQGQYAAQQRAGLYGGLGQLFGTVGGVALGKYGR